jgi:uncharacterized protein with GYD domain
MAKYLFEAKYTVEGLKGLKTEGASAREKAVGSLAESVGGKLEAFYIAFGDTDVYAIIDFPDNSAAAAAALAVAEGGGASVRTVVLLSAKEIDDATKRGVIYRPPGR